MGVEGFWSGSNDAPIHFEDSLLAGHIILELISTF